MHIMVEYLPSAAIRGSVSNTFTSTISTKVSSGDSLKRHTHTLMVHNITPSLPSYFIFLTSKQYLPQTIQLPSEKNMKQLHKSPLHVNVCVRPQWIMGIQQYATDMHVFLPEMVIICYLFHDLVPFCFKSFPLNNHRLETSIFFFNFGTDSCYYFCYSSFTIFSSWKCIKNCFIGCWIVNSLKDVI